MPYRCSVWFCPYRAEKSIEMDDGVVFTTCSLHDSPKTRAMLDRFERPGHFWSCERPIILPVGDLEENDLEPKVAIDGMLYAWEDSSLGDVETAPTHLVHEDFDVVRE